MFEKFDPDDADATGRMSSLIGPQQIDSTIRQAMQLCWMVLPSEKRNVDEVEKEIRRIVERAIRDLREDAESFGIGGN